MTKDRLAAFTDAILAIIMTILVLELDTPDAPTFEAVWALRGSYISYIISFFWLGALWANLHSQWQMVERIDHGVVWGSIFMLFFTSFIPYFTKFMGLHFWSPLAQGLYLLDVLLVAISNIVLNWAVGRANKDDEEVYKDTKVFDRIMLVDSSIIFVGILLAQFVYAPLAVIVVLLAALLPTYSSIFLHKRKNIIKKRMDEQR